jgi:hypothetical protein
MRKLMIVAAGVLALCVGGLAVAKGLKTKTATEVQATFNATTASDVATTTCTTTDGKMIAVSHGRYTGMATGAADLTGPITLDVHSVVNTTDGYGLANGRLKIDVASGKDAVAQYTAVYDHGGVVGFASGHAGDPHVGLFANLSAGFTTAGGFTGGRLGGGTAGGSAVEVGPGSCAPAKPVKETSEARGTVSAVSPGSGGSPGSITVGGLTCSVPPALSAKVATLAVNDRAEIKCQLVNGVNTLVKVTKRK